MKIKVCGMTRSQDAQLAEAMGAWAVGFIFYEGSKRFVSVEDAAAIAASLSGKALKTGVFVNQNELVAEVVRVVGLDMIQLHGDETPADCARIRGECGKPVIKAFCLSSAEQLVDVEAYRGAIDYALIDSSTEGTYGGTGTLSNWMLAKAMRDLGFPLILSGGLTPENCVEAYAATEPFALDLSSGIERSPGIKSEEKMRALFSVERS